MLALIYLGLAIALGDLFCRRFYRFLSVPHRYATAILVGILLSTWFTYLAALAFAHTAEPLLWADLLFFLVAAAICWFAKKSPAVQMIEARPPGRSAYDWLTLGALFIAACVLLLATLYVNKQGRIRVSGIEATDFALQSAIAQAFALGHNFPPESPYYAGQPLYYDFLFYFQVGNLELLGLNLAWAIGVLSVLGLISMLVLVMTLGELLFNSRMVGHVAAGLFFFSGSLAFIPFWKSQASSNGGFPMVIQCVNQRHLPGAIGVFLLLMVFLVNQYRQTAAHSEPSVNPVANHTGSRGSRATAKLTTSFIFSGLLLGALPLWNASVFICAAAVLCVLLMLFPYRLQVMLLGITAAAVALPQLLFLNSKGLGPLQQPLFHWAAVGNPIIGSVITQIGFAAGAKWPVIILALILISSFQRRFFLASCSLLMLPICIRLGTAKSTELTFLNTWSVMTNMFAAYGLWWLWNSKRVTMFGPLTATILTAFIVAGGMVDLVPIRNSSYVEVNYEKDDLVKWLSKNTKPSDVFLSDRFLIHPVLLAGRKIFLGPNDLPGGYDAAGREPIYREMFQSKNPRHVFELLKQNHIGYIAIDDGVRHGKSISDANEYLYVRYFQKIYDDKENRYQKLAIYKVPESVPPNVTRMDLSEPPVSAFQGGKGTGKGQFDNPRGLTVDINGNIFVADTGNSRIEKFFPNGTYIESIGTKDGYGQLGQPNGLAIDRVGNIYVADVATHSVRKLTPDGTLIAQWAPALYGPRRIAIGPDDSIYVVDQGHNRIVKLDLDGKVLTTWGNSGSGDGEFGDPTSVAVDPTSGKIYVADPINSRIQVFDSAGNFLMKWSVHEWGQPHGFEDLAIDAKAGHLYASSANINTVLIFDLQGNRLGTLVPTPPDRLDSASALALAKGKLFVLNSASARVSLILLQNSQPQTSRASDR